MSCAACFVGWHHKCKKPAPVADVSNEGGLFSCCCADESSKGVSLFQPNRQKDNTLVRDVTSTGRKRAVKIKPIDPANPGICEWAYLAKAGGGIEPIVGCAGQPQKAVHHGPDKDTLNNDELNLHAICDHCHNRWHAKNDRYYGERPEAGMPFVPKPEFMEKYVAHDPDTKIGLQELLVIEGERSKKK